MTETGESHWGSLGEPEQQAAKLLHVVDTPVATMRHAFYQPGATVPNYRFACDTLVYGVGGPCIQHHDGARLVRRRLMFYPRGYEHKLEFLGPAHILAIEISPRDSDRNGFSGLSAATPLPATLYTPVWRVMLEAADGEPPESVGLIISELLGMMADFANRSAPACVIDTIDRIHAEWSEVASARALAAQAGVSPQYLCRAFRKATGTTIQQYALLLRLDHARGLLWVTGLPIADIAARTGFADQSHLTRALTADTARTPRRLRSSAPCSEFAREMAHLFSSQDLPRRDVIAPLYPDRLRAAGGLPAPRC
jgi:AraC-like DNA-binding protein